MEKETYWSRFAGNFEELNNYVAGEVNIQAICESLGACALRGDVLELGCGNGTYSKILSTTAQKVWATDYSDEMVEVTDKRLEGYSNIQVGKENCLELSFSDNSFDAVVMVNLLHVISDPVKTIEESNRVLKPGGRLVIVSFTKEGIPPQELEEMFERYLSTYGVPPECGRVLTVEDTRSMVEAGGFRVNDSRLIGNTTKAVFIDAVKAG